MKICRYHALFETKFRYVNEALAMLNECFSEFLASYGVIIQSVTQLDIFN